MKKQNKFKVAGVGVLLLLLLTLAVIPAAAQEPDEAGDVEAQMVDFIDFLWNPGYTYVSRSDGQVVTKLDIQGADQISGMTLTIGYNASVVLPEDVKPGDLLPGTEGVDYLFVVIPGGNGLYCDDDNRSYYTDTSFTVNIVYFDPTVTIDGSGSLVDITWRNDPDAAVGDVSPICLDGDTSLISDNGSYPAPPVPDTLGHIEVEPYSIFTFQIGLEGGKNSGLNTATVPDPLYTKVKINGPSTCQGGGVDAWGFCEFNNSLVSPPYTVDVSRFGYLDVTATFEGVDSSSVFLLGGDLNDDNVINILDLTLMVGVLNQPVGSDMVSNAADFTGPTTPGVTPGPDGFVDIFDLVIVARNFGAEGPTDGTSPPGTFPF